MPQGPQVSPDTGILQTRVLQALHIPHVPRPNAKCLYCEHLKDTAEHTLFGCRYWDASRSQAKAFIGGRKIIPSDIQDMFCDPTDFPSLETDRDRHDRLSTTFGRSAQCFFRMIKGILRFKNQDERIAEAEVRANRQQGAH